MEIHLSKPGEYKETNLKEHFHFVGKKLSEKEIDSFLPFFQCDEIGHEELMLDQVCIEPTCLRKGLTCGRCVGLRHSNHPTRVISLRTFVSDLLKSQTEKKSVLESERESCQRYRDMVIEMAKNFIDELIEHFSIFVASVHKHYTIFENEFEDGMIKSDVIIHRLMHRQHIRRDHFSKYIATTVSQLGDGSTAFGQYAAAAAKKEMVLRDYEKAFVISKQYQDDLQDISKQVSLLLSQEQNKLTQTMNLHRLCSNVPEFDIATLAVQHKFKKDFRTRLQDVFATTSEEKSIPTGMRAGYEGVLLPNKQRKEFAPGDQFQIEFNGGKQSLMAQLDLLRPTLLETHVNTSKRAVNFSDIGSKDAVDLYVMEKAKLQSRGGKSAAAAAVAQSASSPFISRINKSSAGAVGVTSLSAVQSSQMIAPRLSDYLLGGEFYACSVDSSRHKCVLGRLFKSVNDSSILKVSTVRSSLKDISCLCVVSEDVVAVAGRFSPFIEIYRLQDRQIVAKIDTKATQGVKCMLLVRKTQDEVAEWSSSLVVGTYSDDKLIPSYRLDLLRRFVDGQEPIHLSVKNGRVFEKHANDAVTAMAQVYLNEFFVVGFFQGAISIFSMEGSLAINVLPNVYESPVTCLFTVDEGKFFVSASSTKIRFHTLTTMNHMRVEQDVTAFYAGTQNINCLLMTHGFNQEESYLKFQHLICGDLRFEDKEDFKEGNLRVLRTAANNIRMTEEAILPIYSEKVNNSIKDIIVIEPRKKSRIVWILTFGDDHRIKLWEAKSGYTETLKLWEKGASDFLSNKGQSIIKARLLYESIEPTSLKWADVQSKVQILAAYENNNTGKIIIKFAVANHGSKSDLDIYELEMLVSYQ